MAPPADPHLRLNYPGHQHGLDGFYGRPGLGQLFFRPDHGSAKTSTPLLRNSGRGYRSLRPDHPLDLQRADSRVSVSLAAFSFELLQLHPAAILAGYRGADRSHHLHGSHLAHPEHLGGSGGDHPGGDHRPALRLEHFRRRVRHRPQRFYPLARPGGSTDLVDRCGHKPAGRPADSGPVAPVSRKTAG